MQTKTLFLIFILTIFLFPMAARSSSLILRIWGSDRELLEQRIQAGLESVGPDGKLILDYIGADRSVSENRKSSILKLNPQDLLRSLPPDLRQKVLLVESNENYEWSRDTSFGWKSAKGGGQQLQGWTLGNRISYDEEGSYSTLGIAALLSACEGAPFELPALHEIPMQGGEMVHNGEGLCVVNSNRIRDLSRAKKGAFLKESLGCKDLIAGVSSEDWVKAGHTNGHMDLSAVFVGPRTVMIPTLDASCKINFQHGWRSLEDRLRRKGLDVVKMPLAGGCPSRGERGGLVVRSYSNMVVQEDSLLVPQYKGETSEEQELFNVENKKVIETLHRLMSEGKIPKRKVIGFPITPENAKGGGAVRCMTLEIPGGFKTCTQNRLDQVIKDKARLAQSYADCLSGGRAGTEQCRLVNDLLKVLQFIHDEPKRERAMTDAEGNVVQFLNWHRDLLGESMDRLQISSQRSCRK